MNVLLDLSRKENLSVDSDATREDLVEELLEAYEEDRRERETLQNLILKIEESKFSTFPTESPALSFQKEPILPDFYDETSVSIVLRDPSWAMALWEIRRKDLDSWTHEPSFRGLSLRVLEYADQNGGALTFFPIPVPEGAGCRYLHLPTPMRWYSLELHVNFDRESRVLASSPRVLAPPELPENPLDRPGLTPRQRHILELSGASRCETVREKNRNQQPGYPQRIGGWDDPVFSEEPV